jgi:hypothetical protein
MGDLVSKSIHSDGELCLKPTLGNAKQSYLKRIADLVLTEAASHPPHERERELIVVILDQRNHGDRTVDP